MKNLSEAHVAIIGLGLMGGSLAAALSGHCGCITGIDCNAESVNYAKERGWINHGADQLDSNLMKVDAILLATPVRTILRLLDVVARQVTEACLVMDLGSTKREIVSRMERLPGNLHSIGGHPMCGREVSGIQQADALLYQNQPFILVPHLKTTEDTMIFARQVVQSIGSRSVIMEPKQHDRIVAAISHLPYLISCGLVGTAEATAQEESELVWEVAASGFRDTSRLAASDITMMLDILLTNRKAILNSVNQFKNQLDKLEHLIAAEEEELVRQILEKVRVRRKDLFL